MIDTKFIPPLDSLIKDLNEFGEKIQVKAVASGLVAVAKPIKQSMKALAPVRDGALKKSIGHRRLSKTAKGRLGIHPDVVALLVGPTRKVANKSGRKISQAKKAIWQEYGTKSYTIKAKGE